MYCEFCGENEVYLDHPDGRVMCSGCREDEAQGQAEVKAQQFIDEGWFQISRRHRMLARLPEGMTGKEALFEARKKEIGPKHWGGYWEEDTAKWVNNLGEESCAEHFRRVYSTYDKTLNITLDEKTFNAFRSLGGRTR